MKPKKICLNMIVKNESKVIEKCLTSVKKLIDYWVIVDTGSTDGTQEIIKESLKNIPGELHERPWVNFASNRNEAMQLAKDKGDYLLFIDADEVLQFSESFSLPNLEKDFYVCGYRNKVFPYNESDSYRTLLINTQLKWEWRGALHESAFCLENKLGHEILKGVTNIATSKDGARAQDPQKSIKEMEILEKAIKEDPQNPRNYFHLATIQIELGLSSEKFLSNYLKAYHLQPSRVEGLFALFGIVDYFAKSKQHLFGYLVSQFALSQTYKHEYYSTLDWIQNWGMLCRFSECAASIGKKKEAVDAMKKLLAVPNLPSQLKQNIEEHIPKLSAAS